jgi:hypothetical protein
MSSVPVACSLSSDELHCHADELIPGLLRDARVVERQQDGVRLEFDSVDGIVTRIASVIEHERRCCRFLTFTLTVPEADGAIVLDLSGPPGTGDFLKSLMPA